MDIRKLMITASVCAGLVSAACAVQLEAGNYEVVLPAKPSIVERYAAEELTNFLARVLGTGSVDGVKRVRMFLGRASGMDTSAFARDEFRIQVAEAKGGEPASIRIAGRDGGGDLVGMMRRKGQYTHIERATLFGVYQFLEDHAGVRFYFPGELGTVANRRKMIEVPEQDRKIAPYFTVRSTYPARDGVWYEPIPEGYDKGYGKALNWVRQRYETERIPCCHGQNGFKIVERFAATHPEYCQLRKDGTRCTELTKPPIGEHRKQLCQSSAIWDVFFDDIVKSNRTGYVDVMPQDGYRECRCEACQAAYRRKPDGTLAPSYASELVWGKTAELGRRLLAAGKTDVTLTQMSYGEARDVPNLELTTNIQMQVAVSGPWNVHNPKQHGEAIARIRAWEKKVGHKVWLWTYPHKFFQTRLPGIPSFGPRAWGKFFKDAAPHVIGAFCESETDHWLFHYLNYYVFSRIAWNPDADVEEIIAEHNRLMFGKGAKAMAKFFEVLEEKWVKGIAGNIVDTPVGPQSMPPCEYEIWTRVYSPKVMEGLGQCLDAAEAKAGAGTIEAKRVDLIRREIYGPLKAAFDKYRADTGVEAERARRAAFTEESNRLAGVRWVPVDKGCGIDTNVWLSAPGSFRITTTREQRTGHYFAGPKLKKSTRYRISYFVKCDNIVPVVKGGGASVVVSSSRKAAKGSECHYFFPANDNFLSGTVDWIAQVFEFETNDKWDESVPANFYLRVRYAAGTAWFDDVRLDELNCKGGE